MRVEALEAAPYVYSTADADSLSSFPRAVVLTAGSGITIGQLGQVLTISATGGGGTGTVTSVNASGGATGLAFGGGPITTAGTLTLSGTLAIGSGGTGATTASAARTNLGAAAVSSALPQDVNANPGAAGTSPDAARIDHTHQVDVQTPIGLVAGGSNVQGSDASLARADHQHAMPVAAPVNVTAAANSAGSATTFARSDHKHDISTAAAVTLTPSSTNTTGTAATLARSDHTHAVTFPGASNGSAALAANFNFGAVTTYQTTGLQVTIPAGTHFVEAIVSYVALAGSNIVRARLFNATSGTAIANSDTNLADGSIMSGPHIGSAAVSSLITVAVSSTIRVEVAQSAVPALGFSTIYGVAANGISRMAYFRIA